MLTIRIVEYYSEVENSVNMNTEYHYSVTMSLNMLFVFFEGAPYLTLIRSLQLKKVAWVGGWVCCGGSTHYKPYFRVISQLMR